MIVIVACLNPSVIGLNFTLKEALDPWLITVFAKRFWLISNWSALSPLMERGLAMVMLEPEEFCMSKVNSFSPPIASTPKYLVPLLAMVLFSDWIAKSVRVTNAMYFSQSQSLPGSTLQLTPPAFGQSFGSFSG